MACHLVMPIPLDALQRAGARALAGLKHQYKARVLGQPPLHHAGFVNLVVVHHHIDLVTAAGRLRLIERG